MKTEIIETNLDRIRKYTSIAFCQKSFYHTPAWNRAMKCINILVQEGYAVPYDYGRGKGKFTCTPKGDEYGFNKLYEIVAKSNLVIKPYRPRK